MKRCPQCGRAYSDIITSCSVCKISLNGGSAPKPVPPVNPPKPPVYTPPRQEYRQEWEAGQRPAPYTKAIQIPKKSSSGIRKLIPVFLLLVIVLAAFSLLHSDDDETPAERNGSSQGSYQDEPQQEGNGYYEPQLQGDYLSCQINGQNYGMQLKQATIRVNRTIEAKYEALNPRGELQYTLIISLDKNLGPGSYSSDDSKQYVSIKMTQAGSGWVYSASHGIASQKLWGRDLGDYALTITDRSSDWNTYEGTFDATLEQATKKGSADFIRVSNCSFSFTLT